MRWAGMVLGTVTLVVAGLAALWLLVDAGHDRHRLRSRMDRALRRDRPRAVRPREARSVGARPRPRSSASPAALTRGTRLVVPLPPLRSRA